MGREISPLRFGRNDEARGIIFIIGGVRYLHSAPPAEMTVKRSSICVIHVFLHSPINRLGAPYFFPVIFSRSCLA